MRPNRRYRTIIVSLLSVILALFIGFCILVATTQPRAAKTADAATSESTITTNGLTALEFNAKTITDSTAISNAKILATAEQPKQTPIERIYTDARYLAAYLAIGRYENLPGTEDLYEQLLAEIGISILDHETLADEIEAVTASLNSSPALWRRYADETINRSLLPT